MNVDDWTLVWISFWVGALTTMVTTLLAMWLIEREKDAGATKRA